MHVATDLAIDADFFNLVVKSKPGPRKVVYFSSSAAYPISLQTPERNCVLSESMIDFSGQLGLPDMTYGWAKLTGEFLARHAAKSYGLDVVCYRPFSGYGEDQDFTYPFPSVVRRVGNRESPLVVWGSGEQTRDFIYIEDVVDAVLATLDRIKPGEALNLGAGASVSFRQLAERACRIIGYQAELRNDPSKPEGVFARVGDCTEMHRWAKPKTSLDEGIGIVTSTRSRLGFCDHDAAAPDRRLFEPGRKARGARRPDESRCALVGLQPSNHDFARVRLGVAARQLPAAPHLHPLSDAYAWRAFVWPHRACNSGHRLSLAGDRLGLRSAGHAPRLHRSARQGQSERDSLAVVCAKVILASLSCLALAFGVALFVRDALTRSVLFAAMANVVAAVFSLD